MDDDDAVVLTEEQKLLRRMGRLLGFLVVAVVGLVLVVSVLEIQVQSRNKDIHTVGVVVHKAQTSSERAERAVNRAIDASNAGSAVLTPQILTAFESIRRIEVEVQELLARTAN